MLPLAAALALLASAADHWTTYLCLRHPVSGWSVVEANPLAAWLFARLGLVEGLLVDSVVSLVALGFVVRTDALPRHGKVLLLVGVTAWTAAAVANNLGALSSLGLSPLG
jgi:hypothetical protein